MTLTVEVSSVTASELGTFEECQARYYHSRQHYRTGVLQTDRTAADVGAAVHDALMHFQRQMEQAERDGRLPAPADAHRRVMPLIAQQRRRRRLDGTDAAVAARLDALLPGIERAAAMIVEDLPHWALDPVDEDRLVWIEPSLDHGPARRSVELAPGFLVRTRPDVIGLRLPPGGVYQVVIRDFKTRTEPVHPAYDTAMAVRALWALLETQQPRCRWFLVGRTTSVDSSAVDLEVINLAHANGEQFLVRANLSAGWLLEERERIIDIMTAMAAVLRRNDVADVTASPGALCLGHCPFLGYCEPGQGFVRKYHGHDILLERLNASTSALSGKAGVSVS